MSSVAQLIRESQGVPMAQDVLARCQSALDNDLYKAMRALREARAWRLRTIESEAEAADT